MHSQLVVGSFSLHMLILHLYTPLTCSPTHSEWPATGWCTRTFILFCGRGHCHKRYCSLCDNILQTCIVKLIIHCLYETLHNVQKVVRLAHCIHIYRGKNCS